MRIAIEKATEPSHISKSYRSSEASSPKLEARPVAGSEQAAWDRTEVERSTSKRSGLKANARAEREFRQQFFISSGLPDDKAMRSMEDCSFCQLTITLAANTTLCCFIKTTPFALILSIEVSPAIDTLLATPQGETTDVKESV
jgi:hypothetical protein